MKKFIAFCFGLAAMTSVRAQDTFSIVAVDTVTGEVGAAGASCVDLFAAGITDIGFLAELFPDSGAIATQASYVAGNQALARDRMRAGDSAGQIISYLVANDIQGNPAVRQYGVARLTGTGAETAGHTGASCLNYKNHISGTTYNIQGNILLGQSVLDSMEFRFNNEPGSLACKLMAALQGAKVPGADTRCLSNGTSSLFAFLKVMQPTDVFGSPSLYLGVRYTANSGMEPIDSLTSLFNQAGIPCTTFGVHEPGAEPGFSLVPNPVLQTAHLQMKRSTNEPVSITLLDVSGRRIATLFSGLVQGSVEIDFTSYPKGVYLLQIEGKEPHFIKCVRL